MIFFPNQDKSNSPFLSLRNEEKEKGRALDEPAFEIMAAPISSREGRGQNTPGYSAACLGV
jgi:hypothetical protein